MVTVPTLQGIMKLKYANTGKYLEQCLMLNEYSGDSCYHLYTI